MEHWTPEGDCKVTGNKERKSLYKIFSKRNPSKFLSEPKKNIFSKLRSSIGEIPFNWNRRQFYKRNSCKIYKEFPVKFTGISFVKILLLDWFLKNPTNRVFLNFLIRTPNLSKFLNPQEICQDIFFIYTYVYMSKVFNIS